MPAIMLGIKDIRINKLNKSPYCHVTCSLLGVTTSTIKAIILLCEHIVSVVQNMQEMILLLF